MTGPEELLGDTLRERVDHRDVPSTPLREVVGTARRIRRVRRIRNGVVAAVVVGVLATPFVIDATNRPGADPTPTDPTPTPAPHVRLADVAVGEPPAVPWLDGSDYVAADGTRTTLPITDLMDATPYRGGFLASSHGNGRVTLLDDRLQTVWERCGVPFFAVSQDGTRTAYTAGDCGSKQTTLHLGQTDGSGSELTQTMPLERATPFGIVGETVVTSSHNVSPPQLVDFDGPPADLAKLHGARATDEHAGLVTGELEGGLRERSTGAVVDVATGSIRWKALGWSLLTFSPDGSMVVGVHGSPVGTGADGASVVETEVEIFDAETGEQLHEFAMPAGFTSRQVEWEDDEHLLVNVTQGRTQALLRSTLDGAIQLATPAAAYDPSGSIFHTRLAARP